MFPGRFVVTPNPPTHVLSGIPAGVLVTKPRQGPTTKPKEVSTEWAMPLAPTPLYPSPSRASQQVPHVCEVSVRATSENGGLVVPKPGNGQALCPRVLPGWLHLRGSGEPAKEVEDETRLSRPCPGGGRNHSMRNNDKAVTAVTTAYVPI